MFASNIARAGCRYITLLWAPRRSRCKSMVSIRIARELGYLSVDPDTLLTLNQVDDVLQTRPSFVPAARRARICSGAHG